MKHFVFGKCQFGDIGLSTLKTLTQCIWLIANDMYQFNRLCHGRFINWQNSHSCTQGVCLCQSLQNLPLLVHMLQRNWMMSWTKRVCTLKQLFFVKAPSHWLHWNVIPKCVLLMWSSKSLLSAICNYTCHIAHFLHVSLVLEKTRPVLELDWVSPLTTDPEKIITLSTLRIHPSPKTSLKAATAFNDVTLVERKINSLRRQIESSWERSDPIQKVFEW